MTVVELRPVRRWIRRTQSAHRDRGETATTAYVVVFSILVLAAMAQETLAAVFSPLVPDLTGSGALAWAAVCAGLLFATLRRLGPVTVSRPAAYFLLTAPVSRRRLLSPTLTVATVGAALAGAAAALGILGHAASTGSIVLVATGAVLGVLLAVAAATAQARPRASRIADTAGRVAIAAGLAVLVAEEAGWTPPTPGGWPPAVVVVPLTGLLAVVAAAGFLLAVRDLARTPNDLILDSAKTAGTLADSVYGVEPSFLADMLERRYWAHRRLRSTPLSRRLPPLTAQDLLLARRRVPRLLWAAAATTLPLLLSGAPPWLLAGTLLIGTMLAARTTASAVKTDATNPVLLRLLSLTSRRALWQRLWVPAALGTVWATVALGLLQLTGALPPGQWWPLGLALGPIGAVAALRAARAGLVRNDLLPVETPMGSVPTGPVLHAFAGLDLLLLALPTVVALATAAPATWSLLVLQAAVAGLGVHAYLTFTTSPARVELAARS
ncbi:hypothetical protein Aca07nite_62090 [Actinoplanes capillaceus]|uniref:ABC-2 type transport system permease protein n=1 Tax=Actinoplanes campanulatus TaxID=113559 RepID=A0ABQ3WRP9_9ACTN|nr:DUF6297 family protein [Actinoplanes capillaceus]GID48934.1 hypothetical protein Aca07nite_62090 [Actinoplanes capillaceus]